jgi:hypothetical protein
MKKIITDKTVYGGMFVDKYYLQLKGEQWPRQVRPEEWDKYKVGDEYPVLDKSSKVR